MPSRSIFESNAKTRARGGGRRLASASPLLAAKSIELMCAPTSYARNEQIFTEGTAADCLYKIESGCVRTYKTPDADTRQLVAFYLAGDFFGLEGSEHHTVSAEATTPSAIRVIKRKALVSSSGSDRAVLNHLLDLTAQELRRTQRHNLLLLKGAQERVVGFLREMAERGHGQNEIALHMTRRDIADYLGLTIETVSRTLSRLESEAAISLPTPWRVVLHDSAALS